MVTLRLTLGCPPPGDPCVCNVCGPGCPQTNDPCSANCGDQCASGNLPFPLTPLNLPSSPYLFLLSVPSWVGAGRLIPSCLPFPFPFLRYSYLPLRLSFPFLFPLPFPLGCPLAADPCGPCGDMCADGCPAKDDPCSAQCGDQCAVGCPTLADPCICSPCKAGTHSLSLFLFHQTFLLTDFFFLLPFSLPL